MSERQKERDAAKRALQTAKYLCLGYMDVETISEEIRWEDRFNDLARDIGLGVLEQ